ICREYFPNRNVESSMEISDADSVRYSSPFTETVHLPSRASRIFTSSNFIACDYSKTSPPGRGRRASARRVRVQDLTPRPVFIASAVRTAIGKFGGALSSLSAADLGVIAVQEALSRAKLEASAVGEVIIGHARGAGNGPNPARQISYRSGIP